MDHGYNSNSQSDENHNHHKISVPELINPIHTLRSFDEKKKSINSEYDVLLNWIAQFSKSVIPLNTCNLESNHSGLCTVNIETKDKTFRVSLMVSWKHASNFYMNRQANDLSRKNPILYLTLFIMYHSKVVTSSIILSVYVTFIIVLSNVIAHIKYFSDAYTIGGSLFLTLYLGTLAVKGSFSVDAINSKRDQAWNYFLDIPKIELPTTTDTPEKAMFDVNNLSLKKSILAFMKYFMKSFCVKKEYINNSKPLARMKQNGLLEVKGTYFILEAITTYLEDSKKSEHYIFAPHFYSKIAIQFGLLLSIALAIFMMWYSWQDFKFYCENGPSLSRSEGKQCVSTTISTIALGGNTLIGLVYFILTNYLFSSIAQIMYSLDVLKGLCKDWVLRYNSILVLQPVPVIGLASADDSTNEEYTALWNKIQPGIKCDAFQRYLLIKSYANALGKEYETFFGFGVVFNALMCIYGYYSLIFYYTKFHYFDLFSLLILVFNALLLLFFFFVISIANTCKDIIISTIQQSGAEDYAIIGGREMWLSYIAATPITWKVFGYVITQDWLVRLIGTLASGAFSFFILPHITG